MNDIICDNEELKRQIEELERKAEDQAYSARDAKRMKTRCDDLEKDKSQLTIDLRLQVDYNVVPGFE